MGLIFSTLKQEMRKMFKKTTIYFCSGVVSVSWDAMYTGIAGIAGAPCCGPGDQDLDQSDNKPTRIYRILAQTTGFPFCSGTN